MPDSYGDFAPRNHEPFYQIAAAHRHPISVNSNQQIPEMATSYSTYRAQYQPQQLGMRGSPGLPPIRDIDQSFGKYGTSNFDNGYMGSNNGLLPMYSQPVSTASNYVDAPYGRRTSASVYESRPISQTFPPSNRPFPPIKSEPQYQSHPPYDTYNARGPYDSYSYASAGIHPTGPMYSTSSEAGDSRNRRRRGNLPKQVTDILRAWFQDHLDHPYPTEEEKQIFIQQTGLTMNQVSSLKKSNDSKFADLDYRSATGLSMLAGDTCQLCDRLETAAIKVWTQSHNDINDRRASVAAAKVTSNVQAWSGTSLHQSCQHTKISLSSCKAGW